MKQQIPRKWLWSAAAAALAACSGAQGPQGPEGPPGQQGATGAAGAAGAAGQNALVAVAAEAAGANCSGGGISVRSGIDSNGNGTLDAAEVTNTSYVCNGSLDTPAQVLAKVETVDGAGSGLDADLLQGQSLDTVSPAGTVVAFAGPAGRVPTGWFLCDGRAISRTTFVKLFNAIGVFHGIGDGTSTFNIPDYRGRFLRGVDYTANRDPDHNARTVVGAGTGVVSNEVGSVQANATARPNNAFGTDFQGNHTHGNGNFNQLLEGAGSPPFGSVTPTGFDNGGNNELDILNHATMLTAGAHTHTITGGGDNETRPLNGYVNYIIKF
ncbi:MAG TPA: phage tail protein [Myxococcaceae bacterium]|nr:phage tail protein [Myxococcaceae bacterium]